MIRVTTQVENSRTVVTIDGQLAASDVEEIQRVKASVKGKVVLRLAGLDTCTEEGVRLLKQWLNAGAQLENANPFLRMLFQN
jgi:hypothetical protein